MELKVIKTSKEYNDFLNWIDTMFDKQVDPDSEEGEKIQMALLLIKQYEDEHYAIPTPDPIEAIRNKMKEKGLKNKDLVSKIGSKGYVSAVLNKKKPLTLAMAKIFHKELGIPAEVLLS